MTPIMTRTERTAKRVAAKIADALGDILKHDDDHAEAIALIAQALTDRSVIRSLKTLLAVV